MAGKDLLADSASPLYVQLMDRIRQDILQGVYPTGEKIPAEHMLEERYGVSRVTVRRALQELTGAGLLERKQGKGTFVSAPKPRREHRGVISFHDACREAGLRPGARTLTARETAATEEDRRRLELLPDSRIVEIRRLLTADGTPVILETLRFSMAYAWLENAETGGSLYLALREYGIRAEKSLYAFSLARATAEEAELLGLEENGPLMKEEQTVYDQKGRPLHTAVRLIRGDRYTLRV